MAAVHANVATPSPLLHAIVATAVAATVAAAARRPAYAAPIYRVCQHHHRTASAAAPTAADALLPPGRGGHKQACTRTHAGGRVLNRYRCIRGYRYRYGLRQIFF